MSDRHGLHVQRERFSERKILFSLFLKHLIQFIVLKNAYVEFRVEQNVCPEQIAGLPTNNTHMNAPGELGYLLLLNCLCHVNKMALNHRTTMSSEVVGVLSNYANTTFFVEVNDYLRNHENLKFYFEHLKHFNMASPDT